MFFILSLFAGWGKLLLTPKPYDFTEPEVRGRKFRAVKGCQKLNGIDMTETAAREAAIRELFGGAGKSPVFLPVFHCDNGRNIHVGDNFFANYNVTILDNREVRIGDNVMILLRP